MRLLGSTNTRTGYVAFTRCPKCRALAESRILDGDGHAKCYQCHSVFAISAFRATRSKRFIAVCAECGSDVALSPDNEGALGYICPTCQNYVALHYGKSRVDPRTVLSLEWNEQLRGRAEYLSSGLCFVKCRSKKDYVTLAALQVLAKNEEPSFRFVTQGDHSAALVFSASGRFYAAFLVWTEEPRCTLSQIFVVPEERGKGVAKAALRHWVEQYAQRQGLPFLVESPNEKSEGLLLALGYAERRGNRIIELKYRSFVGL
jgi:GNAT superfamily N-acetyltransferase